MKYKNTITGIFKSRPNRFIAKVLINGKLETVHVKNTGRCRELLVPDCKVILEISDNPNRKTAYDLIAVYKENFGLNKECSLINMDSQAPNKAVNEWLMEKDFTYIKPEYKYGDSRIDFYCEKEFEDGTKEKYLMEVKGVTLEKDGIAYFPDAPTERGVKHLRELTKAVNKGYKCFVLFVVQMDGITCVHAYREMQQEFAEALNEAKDAGVKVLALTCKMTENTMDIVTETDLSELRD